VLLFLSTQNGYNYFVKSIQTQSSFNEFLSVSVSAQLSYPARVWVIGGSVGMKSPVVNWRSRVQIPPVFSCPMSCGGCGAPRGIVVVGMDP